MLETLVMLSLAYYFIAIAKPLPQDYDYPFFSRGSDERW